MEGMAWASTEDLADFLRVGEESHEIIAGLARAVPAYVEVTTGIDAEIVAGQEPPEVVKTLARFLVLLWFCPDGADAPQVAKVVHSLTCAVKAMQHVPA